MPRVYVSLGSNIEREKSIRGAIGALRQHFGDLTLSRVYQSQAEGFSGDDFYNLVATFDSEQSLENVRDILARIETAHGRTRGGTRYAARTLDIDILLYGDIVRHDHGCEIPRREIREHAFVLRPLAEIAPALHDPETGERYAELWQQFEEKNSLREVMLDTSTQ